jgi:hypothetical protein
VRYLILSERDREKFGCPDKLPFSLTNLTNREAVMLQKLGFKSVEDISRRLAAYAEDGLTEEAVLALDAMVWLALRRSGIRIVLDETFEYDLDMEWFDDDPEPEPIVSGGDPGKEQAPAASKSSPRTSSASSSTSRRKSPRTR